jgi:hypothetical protein
MRPIVEMRGLRHFKCIQEVPRHFCCLRVSTTVPLKFIDDLALTQKMPLAIADMALDVVKVSKKLSPAHVP